jgi:type IV secretory pathway VirB2 component (pilin)
LFRRYFGQSWQHAAFRPIFSGYLWAFQFYFLDRHKCRDSAEQARLPTLSCAPATQEGTIAHPTGRHFPLGNGNGKGFHFTALVLTYLHIQHVAPRVATRRAKPPKETPVESTRPSKRPLFRWARSRPLTRLAAPWFLLSALPLYAQSTGSDPWDNAVTVLKTAFTGTIATGLSLVAIVVGGLMFAYGEGQSKKTIAGIVFGVGMAIGAVNFMAWLFPS